MKFFPILFITFIVIVLLPYPALAEDIQFSNVNTPANAAADAVDLKELNSFIASLDRETQELLPRLDLKSWGVTGPNWDFNKVGKNILRYFLREIVLNFRLLGELVLLAMALALLQNMRHAFESETVNQIAFSICFLVVMGLVIHSFTITFQTARDALEQMIQFMYAIMPLLFSLVAAGGGVTTTAIVHPILISSVGLMGGFMSDLIFPLILFAGVLGTVHFLVEGFPVDKLANFLKSAALGLMGLAMAIFIGIITIRGFAGSIADSTALRTAKYVTNTFLPVVGGSLSDTMEMAIGCSMVLKGGLGIFGLGLIILIIIFPLMKILAVAVIYQLTGAVIQPLGGNNRLADALHTVGATFLNLFAAIAIVALMFFIALAILVGIAGARIG
jgi:stage III sporulation protein AE